MRGLVAGALASMAWATACQWNPLVVDRPAPSFTDPGEPVAELRLDEPRRDALDCPAGHCQDRFRVEISEPGELRVRVQPLAPDPSVSVRVVVEGPVGVLARSDSGVEGAPASRPDVDLRVGPGPHYVLVQAVGGKFDYQLEATLVPGAAPPDAAVQVDSVPSLAPPRERQAVPTAKPGANFDPKARELFPKWRHYAFADPPEKRLGAGEQVAFPAAEQEVLRAIRYELADRGYFPTEDPREAEFLISAQVGSRSTTWYVYQGVAYTQEYDQWLQQWGVSGGAVTPQTYSDATLVIDFIDPGTGRLLWHGWTTAGIEGGGDLRDTLRAAVREVLALFPPR
jgi:hypothetical protein